MIIAYIIYIIHHTHHILWQYHITNTPSKNKLDASNLLLHILRGLWELRLRTILTYAKPQR
jgi:hypothetical protein